METEDEYLTPGQGSDNMLIRLLDKILLKNKIKKSSLKRNKAYQGKTVDVLVETSAVIPSETTPFFLSSRT